MYKKTIIFFLIFAVGLIGLPLAVFSADEASFVADTVFSANGVTFSLMAGSLADQVDVYSTYIDFTLSANSTIEIRSYNKYLFTSGAANTDCSNSSYSKFTLPGYSTPTTVTVTPTSSTCPSLSGGGGGGAPSNAPTPVTPTTNTGSVTVTVSNGGKTTVTTGEDTTASVEFPANAVSSLTDISITAEIQADILVSKPAPLGKSIIGGYIYSYTAISGGISITNFSKDLALTFTYTNEQILGLNEDSLKVFYWDGGQWVALESIIDKVNNKITVATNHFTYFAIFGGTEAPTGMATPEEYDLKEGDLIRAVGDFDIFIISQQGYKRLFLNPTIFEMYGHLGSWDDVITVTPSIRDAFKTSSHYRYVGADKVYHLNMTGGDTAQLQWLNMTGESFMNQGGKANGIFTINQTELNWYSQGEDKTSL